MASSVYSIDECISMVEVVHGRTLLMSSSLLLKHIFLILH